VTITCEAGHYPEEYPGYFEMLEMDDSNYDLIVWGREAGYRNWEFAW
jgi:hypothetical protein